jgi:predicted ATPase
MQARFRWPAELSKSWRSWSWSVRAAISLRRLRIDQGRPADARALVAPVHDRFTEGFQTADLLAAATMLDTLGG